MKSGHGFECLSHYFPYGRTTVYFLGLCLARINEEDRHLAKAWALPASCKQGENSHVYQEEVGHGFV